MYGTSQPRTLRMISSRFHWRLSGGVSGPGSDSNSGYCGNTGSGRVAPFGCGGTAGPTVEFTKRSLTVTSTRNAGWTEPAITPPCDRACDATGSETLHSLSSYLGNSAPLGVGRWDLEHQKAGKDESLVTGHVERPVEN